MLEIGDVVEIDYDEVIGFYKCLPGFYTREIFTIIDFKDRDVVKLDKNLNNGYGNLIHISLLKKSLKGTRQKKIIKINAGFR
jgi:hypothetical protein